MLKKITIIIVFLLGFGGCAGVANQSPPAPAANHSPFTQEDNSTNIIQTVPPPDNKVTDSAPTFSYPLERYSFVLEDNDGFQTEYTLAIGQWLMGSDRELVRQAWSSVGGRNEMPPGYPGFGRALYFDISFEVDRAAFAVGYVNIRNVTPGWDRENWSALFDVIARGTGFWSGNAMFFGREYSNGATFNYAGLAGQATATHLVSASVIGNNWRAPVVIIFSNAVFAPTPNNPDGFNPNFGTEYFFIPQGDIEFTIAKSWETGENQVVATTNTEILSIRDEEENVLITNFHISAVQVDERNERAVLVDLTQEGAILFEQATRDNLLRPLYVFVNGQMIAAPIVNSVIIAGRFSIDVNEENVESLVELIDMSIQPQNRR